jgi:ribose transport system ATP-binding protein
MEHISKRFGATHALCDVSLDVRPGSVLALIGENGAGKSTLMKVLSGAIRPDSGRMSYQGRAFEPRNPHDARTAGVAMIYQELNLAGDLSVEDNIMLGQEQSRFGLLDRAAQRRRVREVLGQLGHADLDPSIPVRHLSVGTQQVVEIARALVVQARVIVFDEPTSSLTRHDIDRLFQVIRTLKEAGLGIVYISHFLEEIRKVCDSFAVLRDGRSVGSGKLAGVSEQEIVSLMVGRSVDKLFPSVPHTAGEVVLSVSGLSGKSSPADVSFDVRRGEILGIAGLVGAGRTELLRCLFGLDAVQSGRVRIGTLTPAGKPRARIDSGMGFVSEDRKTEGLAQSRSIADNATYTRLDRYSRFGWLNLRRRRQAVQEWLTRLSVKARSQDQEVSQLSGGNQQKVAIARVLHQDANVLLLDEPTRGIDVGTKAEIYRLIGELAARGKAVIFVSSYLTELLAVCDRVAVMARGRLREVRPASEWTEETAMGVAVSGDAS